MQNIIEIKNLTKKYNEGEAAITALDNINLEIKKGEFVAIMGPSGSGKSTLLNIIGCLDRPTKGSYLLENEEVAKKSQKQLADIRNNKIGFVFQQFNLLPRFSVYKNIELPLVYAKRIKNRREKILNVTKLVNLEHRLKHKPNQLSGGEQQRVAIARALINNPSIILADEPTGNLDSKSGIEIMEILKRLNQRGTTIILVTHEEMIANYADRIIKIKDGRIIQKSKS